MALSAAELHVRIFNVFYLKFHLLYALRYGKLKEETSCGDMPKISSGV
jgi:hypothetical protein